MCPTPSGKTPPDGPAADSSGHDSAPQDRAQVQNPDPRDGALPSRSELSETTGCACFNTRKTARAVTQHFSKFLAATGLKETQFSILSVLAQTGPAPMGKLADFLVMDRTTLTRNLAPLRGKSYIETTPGKDGRTRLVRITDAGLQILATALPEWRKAQESLITLFGVEEWNALQKNLDLLQSISRGEHAR